MKVTCEPKGIQVMNKGNKLANASIVLDDAFVIRNLSVMNGPNGVFVSMPSQKGLDRNGNTAYYDTAFPLNAGLRAEINDVVINAYEQKLKELQQGAQYRSNDYQQGQQGAQYRSNDYQQGQQPADPNQAEDDQFDYGF